MGCSKMSDFEINCEVLSVFSPDIKHMCLSGDNSCFYDCGPTGDGWHQIDIPDHCNNPADAWPIIEKYRISFLDQLTEWCVDAKGVSPVFEVNPLRGAMIVFLLMQESANVQTDSAR